ncbi:HAMP domain-containing sensor histidine kinase [Paenibacillus sp. MMS20-IR301]|uniref:sensor histidine kinase n=1 Tax=Paenibacillus sp. MMS20-IR301 TaxID=2895946 RepID=UPI0028E787BC|nr:HAMP domain-containing sensor histidine kinase [Paenibacillus sp. MMS20-IR301]WNS43704.1 HAMP domain-containing sensor histidine kinase [Paenibacillus sp. MMS20-IR301]
MLNYKSQIHQIGNQLSFIMEHQSLKFIATQLKPREINHLVSECNTLLNRQRALDEQFTRKNQEMNSTIISLSHDIRTPLTSLDGYLQLALRAAAHQDMNQYVTLAQSRIKQIIKLVDELFLYTKLQNPEYIFELQPVDVMDVLKQSLFTFIEDFTRCGYEPELQLPEKPVMVSGDMNAVERVFANIISNYFIHGDGPLSVAYEDRQDNLCIRFTNRLKAGSRVDIDKVFTRFYKEDPSRTMHSSGLGLSIVKALAAKMNGYTKAECIEDTFSLTTAFGKTAKEHVHGR